MSSRTNFSFVRLTSSLPSPQKTSPASVETTDVPRIASGLKTEDSYIETEISSPTKHICSILQNDCPSECCIGGECVDSSRCKNVFAGRGGRAGGGRGGGFRGGDRGGSGGYSGNSSGKGFGLDWKIVLAIVFGSIFLFFILPLMIICICPCNK